MPRNFKAEEMEGCIFMSKASDKRVRLICAKYDFVSLQHKSGRLASAAKTYFRTAYLPAKNAGVDCDVIGGPCACGAWH